MRCEQMVSNLSSADNFSCMSLDSVDGSSSFAVNLERSRCAMAMR